MNFFNIFKNKSKNNSSNNNLIIPPFNQIDNSILFFKVWRTYTLKLNIFKFNRYLDEKNIIELNSIQDYNNRIKNNYFIKSIIMNDAFTDTNSLLLFLKELPSNIEYIEIKNSILYVDIKRIELPSTLKVFKFDNQLHLVNYKHNNNNSNNSSNIKNSRIISLKLGLHCDEIIKSNYLPTSLKSLVLSCLFSSPITKSMIPNEIKSIKILSEYGHPSISLPKQLLKLSYGEEGFHHLNPQVLNCFPPTIESLKLYAILDVLTLIPLNAESVRSLKKLNMVYEFYGRTFSEANSRGTLSSLTSLDLSLSLATFNSHFDIDSLPPNLVKLKLPNITDVVSSSNIGYPASLTSLEGYRNHYKCKFQDPLNLKYITIKIFNYGQSNFINLNQFSNLLSIKYFNIDSPNRIVLPDNSKINNLEITYNNKFSVSQDINNNNKNSINISNSIIKSIKLDANYSYLLFNSSVIGRINSIFPSTLILLDITFHSSISDNYYYPPLSIENLPSSIKYLIIRGDYKVSFFFPLPQSLEQIFISNKNSSSTLSQLDSKIITIFKEEKDYCFYKPNNSKLYNKIKNLI